MIRALQKKFVVTAMIAVSVLLLVVLGALNVRRNFFWTTWDGRGLFSRVRKAAPSSHLQPA